jgi:hypothetical protein
MKQVYLKEPPIIYGFMMYQCEKCGEKFRMAMEIGVEDHGDHGRPHQPCPFVIAHSCGGLARDITMRVERFRQPMPAAPLTRYFAYDHSGRKDACGNPRIYMGKERQK